MCCVPIAPRRVAWLRVPPSRRGRSRFRCLMHHLPPPPPKHVAVSSRAVSKCQPRSQGSGDRVLGVLCRLLRAQDGSYSAAPRSGDFAGFKRWAGA